MNRAVNDAPVGMRAITPAIDRVDHQHGFGDDRFPQHGVADAELIEHGEGIGAELDAVADHAELGRLFEQAHREALARQRQRDRAPPSPPPTTRIGSPLPAKLSRRFAAANQCIQANRLITKRESFAQKVCVEPRAP